MAALARRLRSTLPLGRLRGWLSRLVSMVGSDGGAVIGGDDPGGLQELGQALEPHHLPEIAADGEVPAAQGPEKGGLAVLGRQDGESLGRVAEAERELGVRGPPAI